MVFIMVSKNHSGDSEFNISQSAEDNSNLSSDDIYSESSESENDDVKSVRM